MFPSISVLMELAA